MERGWKLLFLKDFRGCAVSLNRGETGFLP